MATYTPNFNLYMPDSTDPLEDFRAEHNNNMQIIDQNLGGGGGGGHTIVNPSGTDMPAESKLQFTGGVTVTDDSVNGKTVVDISGGGGNVYGAFVDTDRVIQSSTTLTSGTVATYTATEDCAVIVGYYGTATDGYIKINGVNASTVYVPSNSPLYLCETVYVRKGQIVTMKSVQNNGAYTVYGLIQGTDSIFTPIIYSDNERVIGIWRDNKPLYQRTYDLGSEVSVSNSTWQSTGIDVSNVEMIPKCGALAADGTYQSDLLAWNNGGDLYIQTPRNSTGYARYLILQYTKTTDSAGSGNWNTDGVPTVHYSTSEQVIGTWYNGKPIYRKIFTPTVNVGSNTISHGIADFEECVSIRGMCKYNNTSEHLPLPYVSTNTAYLIALGNVSPTSYLVEVGSGFSSIQDCKIIIEYTKTTD